MNCHSFANNRPDLFALQVRPGMGKQRIKGGMFVVRDGRRRRIEDPVEGRAEETELHRLASERSVIAFSMTKTKQIFHAAGARNPRRLRHRVAIWRSSNLRTGAVSTSPDIADPDMQEAFPCWSADGKMLYFCRAKTLWGGEMPPRMEDLKKVKYDLMRVQYDVETNRLGSPETVLAAAKTGLSIGEPRPSPDGRYLLFCMAVLRQLFPLPVQQRLVLVGSQERPASAVGVQQRQQRSVALLVEQLALDRLQQPARRTAAEQPVLQLYRRERARGQAVPPATERPASL